MSTKRRPDRKFPFTRRALETLPPHNPARSGGNGTEYTDAGCCGLKAISGPSGRVHFLFRYTFLGRKKAMALGEWPAVSIEAARKKVYACRAMLAEGQDPKAERDDQRVQLDYKAFLQDVYLPHAKARKTTWDEDERKIRNIPVPALGHLRLDAITTRDIATLHNSEKERTSPTSANHVIRLISATLNVASKLGYMDKNKVPQMPNKFKEKRRERYLSKDELSRFLKALENQDSRGCADAVKLLLFSGCRKMEILSLRWENVRFDEETIYLPETKNGRPRNVFLNAKALEVLEALRAGWDGKNPYVFPTKTGGKMPHLMEVRKTFSGACREAGIADFHLHDLRHSFASLLVSNGGTLYEAQQLLGHLDQNTTLRYAHLSQDTLRKASQRVAEQIEKAAV